VPAYEAGDFEPPAPVARAIVRGPAGRAHPDVRLLIDSGADVSVVPQHVAEGLGAAIRSSDARLRMYDGSETACDVAELSVDLLRFRFTGSFVVLDTDHGIVGRNILDLLVVTLDGPRQVWSA
jgi:hypothetical protein